VAATALTIGTYTNVMDGQKNPHFGSIRRARIFKRELTPSEVLHLYNTLAPTLRPSPVQTREFWVHAAPLPSAPSTAFRSPRSDYADSSTPSSVVLRGSFNLTRIYVCRFTGGKDAAYVAVSKPANVSCSVAAYCMPGFGDMLTCHTPLWQHGFLRTTLSVLAMNGTNSSGQSSTAYQAPVWMPVWQRMCFTPTCGYTIAPRAQQTWWTKAASTVINPYISGVFTRFTFTTESRLFTFDPDAQRMTKVSSFGGYEGGCTADTCILGMRTCRSGPSVGAQCSSSADCADHDCTSLKILGASSVMHFTDGDKHYLAAANYWDGASTFVRSSLFLLNTSSDSLSFVQDWACNSARKMLLLSFANESFMFVTSHLESSRIIPWNSGASPPLADSSAYHLATVGATSAAAFSTFEDPASAPYMYLVVSSWPLDKNITSRDRGSRLYVLGKAHNDTHTALWEGALREHMPEQVGHPAGAVLVSTFDVENAQDVVHFEVADRRYLVFAVNSPTAQSVMYSASLTADPPVFELQQYIATTGATSVVVFRSRTDPYIVVTQAQHPSMVLGWDYAKQQLRAVLDVTGVQFFPTKLGLSAAYFQGNGDDEYLLFGSYRGVPSGMANESVHFPSLLVRSRKEQVAMSWPISVAVSNTHVYVATHDSRQIAIFRRDAELGTVVQADGDSFTTQWTRNPVTDENPPPSSGVLGREAFGYPLNGVRTILLSPDFAHLYAVSMGDNSLIVFNVDQSTGKLNISQILDSSTLPMLGGAAGLGFGGVKADTLYVVSGQQHAITLLQRNNVTGHLNFSDDLRDGERFVNSFRDDTNDTMPYMSVSHPDYSKTWENGRFPVRLGGNGYKWSNTSRDSVHFPLKGVLHLVVAHSDMDPSEATNTGGAAVIYVWDDLQSTFHMRQMLTENTAASSVTYFMRTEQIFLTAHYLVVANGLRFGGDVPVSINVYKYNETSSKFNLFQILDQPIGVYSNSIVAFAITSTQDGSMRHFLAVANTWTSEGMYANLSNSSQLYQWRETPQGEPLGFSSTREVIVGGQVLTDGPVMFDTNGAMQVDYLEMLDVANSSRTIRLLAFASFSKPSRVDVYQLIGGTSNTDILTAKLLQRIDSLGQTHGLDMFSIRETFYMVVAHRQSRPAYPHGDVLIYDLVCANIFVCVICISAHRLLRSALPSLASSPVAAHWQTKLRKMSFTMYNVVHALHMLVSSVKCAS
jgi:hypothetical protein